MIPARVWLWTTSVVLASALPVSAPAEGMADPAIDGLTGPFSYLAKPSVILGGIGASGVTQVTWDGAFYTGACELCIVTGDPPAPVAVRVKQLALNYLPILHYAWQQGEVRCSVSAFAAAVSEQAGPANFIRLGARRMGSGTEPAFIGFGIRHSGLDHRAGALETAPFTASRKYQFTDGCALIGDRVVCILPGEPPAKEYAVLGEPYDGPFNGEAFGLKRQTAALIALWHLGDQQELSIDLKMPWQPLPLEPGEPVRALKQARHDDFMQRVVESWHLKLAEGMQVRLPEEKPQAAYRANLAQALTAIEHPAGSGPYLVNRLRKQRLRPAHSAVAVRALDLAGHHSLARGGLESLLGLQSEDGCLSLDGNLIEHCTVMQAAAFHLGVTGDPDWAQLAWPRIVEAADWLSAAPPGDGARGHLARVAALAAVRDIASRLGREDEARALTERCTQAATAVARAATEGALPTDIIPAVLDLAATGSDGSIEALAEVWPEQMTGLCQRLRAQYAEGVLAPDGLLDLVATADTARLHAIRGEQEQAIRDLYALLVHTGSCHEGFAVGVTPWSDRDSADRWPAHPLFAAAYVTLLRDLLVREAGSDLHLLSAISPEWLKAGKDLIVENARTAFGPVSLSLAVSEQGAEVTIAADWRQPPGRLILHLPYAMQVTQASADQPGLKHVKGPAPRVYEEGDFPTAGATGGNEWVELPADATRVSLEWTTREVEPVSYAATLAEWQARYRARYDEYIGSGKAPVLVEPVPLR